jgi:hypothetical protein
VVVNRHERRRASRQRRVTLADFHAESAGCFALHIIRSAELLLWLTASQSLKQAIAHWLAGIDRNRPLCIDCNLIFTRTHPPVDWLLALPERGDVRSGILMGVCSDCSSRLRADADLFAAAVARLRKGIWPDLRALDPVHMAEGGRA